MTERAGEPLVTTLDPESDTDRRDVVRLWFLGEASGRKDAVGVAILEPKNLATDPGLSRFVPFPANPVLRADDRALDCADCDIEGVAVSDSPDPGRPGLLRLLVARRVQQSGGGRIYDLFPLEQAWDPTLSSP